MEKEKLCTSSTYRPSKETKQKMKWTDIHPKSFDNIKRIMTKKTILNYLKFDKHFYVHTDESDRHMGAVIGQNSRR